MLVLIFLLIPIIIQFMSAEVTSEQQSAVQQLLESVRILFGTGFVVRVEGVDMKKATSAVQVIGEVDPDIIANSIPVEGTPNEANLLAIFRSK